jgi:DNA repair photolyase
MHRGYQIIYEPQGKAREYAELAANLYWGCDHQCWYCYGPRVLHVTREEFIHPKIRENALERFHEDCLTMRHRGDERRVLLSFITDPYCHFDVEHQITRRAIEILNECHINHDILSKGGHRAERDLDILNPNLCRFATTLVFTEEAYQRRWEPNAASTRARITSLIAAHNAGLSTWVSLEPVIEPSQSLQLISMTCNFVDEYRLGRWNYAKGAAAINWKAYLEQAMALLDSYGVRYMVKSDLREAADESSP